MSTLSLIINYNRTEMIMMFFFIVSGQDEEVLIEVTQQQRLYISQNYADQYDL